MKFLKRPLSYSAMSAWRKNVNQYALYRLGYVSRMPALHRGIDVHARLQDVFMGRAAPGPQEGALVGYVTAGYDVVGVEVSVTNREEYMTGRIDLLLRLSSGELLVADIKTGRPRDEHSDQIHWYAAILEDYVPASGGLLLYLDRAKFTAKTVELYYDRIEETRETARRVQYEIARQAVPETVIVPIHGTTFVDEAQLVRAEKGLPVAIQVEWVDTEDRGRVWGRRILLDGQPLGWIPDSLKERIKAEAGTIFASRPTTEHRNGYVRLEVPADTIDWSGIAA